MAIKRTFLDSSVLISAHKGKGAVYERAMEILGDPNREFVINQYISLEVLPIATYCKREKERHFYREFIDNAVEVVESAKSLSDDAIVLASQHGLGPIDALHATSALRSRVVDFVTAEGQNKPFMRVPGLNARSIADQKRRRLKPFRLARKWIKQMRHELHVWWQKRAAALRRGA